MSKRIFIDPGHGGRDPGAVGNGMRESDIVLDVAKHMAMKLHNAGHTVLLSRYEDAIPADRVGVANSWQADYFISIHANGFSNPAAHGTEAFIFDNFGENAAKARALAASLLAEFVAKMETRNRGVKPDTQTQHANGLPLLRNAKMPAVLFELAFVTAGQPHNDAFILQHRRAEMANALAEGLRLYLESQYQAPAVGAAAAPPPMGAGRPEKRLILCAACAAQLAQFITD